MPLPLFRSCLVAAAFGGQLLAQAPSAPGTPTVPPKPAPPVLDHNGIKLIPQPGVAIPDADRAELTAGVAALGKEIDALRRKSNSTPENAALLPDVMIFHKAVDWALRYNEFFNDRQVALAKQQLAMGMQRAKELQDGKPSWISATGLVPRGYISKIDGSLQPYGMVIPEDWKPGEKVGRRLAFWAHGRGETLSELDFINQRLTSKGEFTPPGVLTLHLYGRYCCANKFAGEVDLFEALENAKTHYNIDRNKLVVRGFSMGGGATWQFGTHFAGMWAAVQPGAGFGETKEFMRLGQTPDKPLPPEWEQKLWAWYDSTDYVANLANTTTVAYSGEIDGQKQAADIMIRYARKDAGNANPPVAALNQVEPGDGSPNADEARVTGTAPDVEFYHVIGPGVPHKIKPEAKPEIEKLVEAGILRHEATPKKVRFVTYSLIYPQMEWVRLEGLDRQWERAEVTAEVQGDKIVATTKNVSALQFISPFESGLASDRVKTVTLDGQALPASWNKAGAQFHREVGQWVAGPLFVKGIVGTKRPGICGPIDHAFMSSFIFVKPTGKPLNEKVAAWAAGELEHAAEFWRRVFRGEAPVKDDTAITDDDIRNSNLVLWGDPSSNVVLKKIVDKLPVKWDAKQLVFAGQTYDAAHTAPVLVFPNPLNPSKYIVLNSGPTFREQALLNNADQTPKLPDWAIIDLNTPADGKWPGKVEAAGFFDEQWQVPAAK